MLYGYDQGVQRVEKANSCVLALQEILQIWDDFIGSGVHEEDDCYEELVSSTIDGGRQADRDVFEDEESWWSRVFEEIEYGVLAPE